MRRRFAPVGTLILLAGCGGYVSVGWGPDPCCWYPYETWAPYAASVADFDQDGRSDAIVGDRDGRAIYFLKGLGGGSFVSPPAVPIASAPLRPLVLAGSLDGDASPDLLVVDRDTGSLTAYLGDGGGGFTAALPPPPLQALTVGFRQVVAGLMDADDHTDLVILDELGEVTVLLGEAGGLFSPAPGGRVPAPVSDRVMLPPFGDAKALVLAEFDGVPGLDVAVCDAAAREIRFYPGGGDGSLGPAVPLAMVLPGLLLDAVAIYDGDSGSAHLAVLWGTEDGFAFMQKAFTHGDAAGYLSQPPVPVGTAARLTAADLDGDGATEILAPDAEAGLLRVFR